MSRRLQVLLPEKEMQEIQRIARREQVSVGEWVRRALREAREAKPTQDPTKKVASIRAAARHAFPTAEIDQMLREIEQGYEQ